MTKISQDFGYENLKSFQEWAMLFGEKGEQSWEEEGLATQWLHRIGMVQLWGIEMFLQS